MDHALQIPSSTLDAVGDRPTPLFEHVQTGIGNMQKRFELLDRSLYAHGVTFKERQKSTGLLRVAAPNLGAARAWIGTRHALHACGAEAEPRVERTYRCKKQDQPGALRPCVLHTRLDQSRGETTAAPLAVRGYEADPGRRETLVAGTKDQWAPGRVPHQPPVLLAHEPPIRVRGADEEGKLLHQTGRAVEFVVEQLPQLGVVHSFSNRDGHVRFFSLSAFVRFGRKLHFLEWFRVTSGF
jgi:hypothetical protein